MPRSLVMATCIGLAALAVYWTGLAPELTPRSNLEHDLAFQVTDPIWLQQTLPRVGGPESWWPSGLVERSWASLPFSLSLNLLSAALAATAAALLTFIMSGWAGAPASMAAGLGFALSPAVWAAAVASEGDTSTLFLTVDLLVIVACTGAWARTRRWAILVAAVSALGVAVAQDLVIGLTAAALFAATRPHDHRSRVQLGAAAVVVVAVAYQAWALDALVGPRVGDGAPPRMVEAWVAMWRWGFEPSGIASDILYARVTALASVVMLEIGVLGCIVAALGLRRSVPLLACIAALALAACGGPLPGMWDPATRAVLPLAAAWALTGLGIGRAAAWAPVGGRSVALVLCLLLPIIQAARTAEARQLIDRPAGQLLHALLDQQTGQVGVVAEGTRFGRLLVWANERRVPSRGLDLEVHDPDRLSSLLAGGRSVFATETAAARLSLSGFTGPSAPVYGRSLDDLLQSVSRTDLVALVATPGAFDSDPEARQSATRLAKDAATGEFGVDEALVLLARRADDLAHLVSNAEGVEVSAGDEVTPLLDPSLVPRGGARFVAGKEGARLEVGALELAHVTSGAILATWSARDGSLDWSVFERRHGLTAAWRHDRWALSRLGPRRDCARVGRNAWSDVTRQATAARIGVEIPRGGRLRLYVAHHRGLFVRAAAFPNRPSPDTTTTSWDRALADQASAATAALAADGVPPSDPPAAARFLWQITVAAPDVAPLLLALGVGGGPDWVRARLEPGMESGDATLCPGVAGTRLFARDGQREDSISLADTDSFGDGWSAMFREGSERWRESRGLEADLLARVDIPRTMEVAMTARAGTAMAQSPGRVGLRVNGAAMETHGLNPGDATYKWTVPRERWRVGTNHLVVTVLQAEAPSGVESRPPVLRVTSIRFRR